MRLYNECYIYIVFLALYLSLFGVKRGIAIVLCRLFSDLFVFFFSNAFYSQNQFKIRHGDGVDHAAGLTGLRTLVRM